MSKYELPLSTKKREIPVITPEVMNDSSIMNKNNSDSSVIALPKGSTLNLTPKHIGDVIQIGHTVVTGMIDIIKIREQGEQNVKKIEGEIKKIIAEAEAEVIKIEASSKDWHGKFDKRQNLILSLIDKIEANSHWSDETKKDVIKLAQKGL